VVERPGTTRQRLRWLFDAINGLFAENVPVMRVAHSLFHGQSEGPLNFDFSSFNDELLVAVRRLFEDGLRAGEVREVDPADAAMVLMGLIGVAAGQHLHANLAVSEERLHHMLDIVCDGVLKARPDQGEERQ